MKACPCLNFYLTIKPDWNLHIDTIGVDMTLFYGTTDVPCTWRYPTMTTCSPESCIGPPSPALLAEHFD